MRALVAVVVLAVGSGDNELDTSPGSGSRLKLTWYDFADGARERARDFLAEYFDSELGVPCRPVEWDDGTLRCVPDQAQVVYADAACTQRLARDPGYAFATEDVYRCEGCRPARLFPVTGRKTVARYW